LGNPRSGFPPINARANAAANTVGNTVTKAVEKACGRFTPYAFD
jgi:hypothetical protein